MKKVFYGILLILLFLMYFFRPYLHWFFFFFYRHYLLSLLLLLLMVLWGTFLYQLLFKKRDDSKESLRIGFLRIILSFFSLLLIILYPFFYSILLRNTIVGSIQYNPISTLEDSTSFRFLPLPVVERISRDRYQEPTHRLLDYQPLIVDQSFAWITPRTPDGFINTWRLRASGLMIVDDHGSTTLIDKSIKYAEGQRMHHNVHWQILKEKYFIQLPEILYIPYDEEIYVVAPYLKWRLAFPVRYPEIGGVYILDSQGNMSHYTREEAEALPFIQRIIPEYLARLYAESYALNNGILNYLFFHEDQIEVIDIGPNNQQPYLLPTRDGLMWFTATEPYGDAYGVFKIFMTHSITGKTQILELDIETMLLGPQRSISYIRQRNPEISWYEETTKTGTFVILEPRPLIVDGDLYWLTSVTTRDFAEISYTALVNAATREVTRIPSIENLVTIIERGELLEERSDDLEGRELALRILEEIEREHKRLEEKMQELKTILKDL